MEKQPGSNFTMPRVTWEWVTRNMSLRWPNTRRRRTVDVCVARGLHINTERVSEIEPNPEAKETRSSRKNGR